LLSPWDPQSLRLSRASCIASREQLQLILRDGEFCNATIQADDELGKYPDNRLIDILQSRKMNRDFSVKIGHRL